MESTHEVEKKIKAAVYLTKAKQGKSDIWKQFSIVTEKNGKELNLVSCDKCAKVFVYNEHKSGTSVLRRHTYFLDGYNGQKLKAMSSNGKCTLFIVPLQEKLNITPLPSDAKEFENITKVDLCTSTDDLSLRCQFWSF